MKQLLLAGLCAATFLVAGAALAQKSEPLMRDFMGINAHTVQFDAQLYSPLCRLVRDYHPFAWDVLEDDTSRLREFPIAQHIGWTDQSGRFRSWDAPVNWNELYGSWNKAGFEVDACIEFDNIPPDKWTDIAADAYRYGKAFAQYFGTSGEHKLVTSIEIGNEPAGNKRYAPEQYKVVFEHLARGVRDGDPKLTILTCAAEAGDADGWSMPLDTFADAGELYDVINVHKYAMSAGWPTWERTFPEDPRIDYRGTIQKSIDWRDRHVPDKQVWITEFGYDASSNSPDPDGPMAEWKDVTDLQQAQWIVRSFLLLSALDLDRAYLYWFNDSDTPSLHAASGVTRNFQPKPSYFAMRHLYRTLGDYRFGRTVTQVDADAYVFEYIHGDDPNRLIWVAWSPTGTDREAHERLTLPGTLVQCERMPAEDDAAASVHLEQRGDGSIEAPLTESPLYLWIQR